MGRKIDPPGQRCGRDEDLDVLVGKQLLYQRPVDPVHASMVDGKAIGEQVSQLRVLEGKRREGGEGQWERGGGGWEGEGGAEGGKGEGEQSIKWEVGENEKQEGRRERSEKIKR